MKNISYFPCQFHLVDDFYSKTEIIGGFPIHSLFTAIITKNYHQIQNLVKNSQTGNPKKQF